VINTSKQKNTGTASTVGISIEIEDLENLDGVSAYCLLIHDRIIYRIYTSKQKSKKTCINADHNIVKYIVKIVFTLRK
jgi:hypothetical protein